MSHLDEDYDLPDAGVPESVTNPLGESPRIGTTELIVFCVLAGLVVLGLFVLFIYWLAS